MCQVNKVQIVRLNKNLPLPEYKTIGSSGMDLYASIDETILLHGGEHKLIPTGIKISMPAFEDDMFILEAQVRPRSGLALKNGISIVNSPGTIDLDYRGEIGVILINHSDKTFEIKPGDRIAQLVFNVVCKLKWYEVEELNDTTRGSGGFGSTGK